MRRKILNEMILCSLIGALLWASLLLRPAAVEAIAIPRGAYVGAGAPAANTLPVPVSPSVPGATVESRVVPGAEYEHQMKIHQTAPRVAIEWKSFNIGENAWTHFKQPGTSSIALNRIYDQSPSLIFGKLSATGQVYLINQGGILFGPGAQVNLHSLIASSLNMNDADFMDALWRFKSEHYNGGAAPADWVPGVVSNHGEIESGSGGFIWLLGSSVENNGTISTPVGRSILASASGFEFRQEATQLGDIKETVDVDFAGSVVNFEDGRIVADLGQVGIYGRMVRQEGLIRSVSSLQKNGSIELVASEKIDTRPGSLTEIRITDSSETLVKAQDFNPGRITVEALGLTDTPSIHLGGEISVRSGVVSVLADGGRIYMAPGSRIDTSGVWVDREASDMVLSARLNSLELRDEPFQKNGILLGKKIHFYRTEGTAIGNISESLGAEQLTALEQSTTGGGVQLFAGEGDIIVDSGAAIQVSGGGFRYASGSVYTTQLRSGQETYRISEAPGHLAYDAIVNHGGSQTRSEYAQGYIEGHDAGSVDLKASGVAYLGGLDAGAESGIYQVRAAERVDDLGYTATSGLRRPRDGLLTVGLPSTTSDYWLRNPIVEEIRITRKVPSVPVSFDPDLSPYPFMTSRGAKDVELTVLSSEALNASKLGTVSLGARGGVHIASDAEISLKPESEVELVARRFVHEGKIRISSGLVNLRLASNETTDAIQFDTGGANFDYIAGADLGPERIHLSGGSRIDVSGEKIDNSGGGVVRLGGRPDGGSVTLNDQTFNGEGVVLEAGSVVDVSGGYIVDTGGGLTAGAAGSLAIQGAAVVLDGSISGLSLVGATGGRLSLHASSVAFKPGGGPTPLGRLAPDEFLPADREGLLVLGDSRLQDTGFTRISISSVTDLDVASGTRLSPSSRRMRLSGYGLRPVTVSADQAGASLWSLSAGAAFTGDRLSPGSSDTNSILSVEKGASVSVFTRGAIRLKGPGVDLAGALNAASGVVTVAGTSTVQDVTVRDTGNISAQGAVLFDNDPPFDTFEPVYEVFDGGNVKLSSGRFLILEPGSRVDVSGSAVARSAMPGGRVGQTASAPGSISLLFRNDRDAAGNFLLAGTLVANKQLSYLGGGALSVRKTNEAEGLSIAADSLAAWAKNGFDDVTLSSRYTLSFSGSTSTAFDRRLTLSTPVIAGTSGADIRLSAPYVKVENTYAPVDFQTTAGQGIGTTNTLELSGDYLDVEGDVKVSGYDRISFRAGKDMRLSDYFYVLPDTGQSLWGGRLATAADLVLDAARIYPTTGAVFDIDGGGNITILKSGPDPGGGIASAVGRLSLWADGSIDHRGVLSAPLGQIRLEAGERVILDDTSEIRVAGELPVFYGELIDSGAEWNAVFKDGNGGGVVSRFETLPEKLIRIEAAEILSETGALLDLSSGGGVYVTEFVPGLSGSLNPFSVDGRSVILPGFDPQLPGEAVWISQGGSLLNEGLYTVLPEEYADLPGALVIEDRGPFFGRRAPARSEEGFSVALGGMAVADTGVRSDSTLMFTVRTADSVRNEGHFEKRSLQGGDAGTLIALADTNIFNATVDVTAEEGYRQGRIELSGKGIVVGGKGAGVDADFGIDTDLTSTSELKELIGKLFVNSKNLSQGDLGGLFLGDLGTTDTIRVKSGSTLIAREISLAARQEITLEGDDASGRIPGARLSASGGDGAIRLLSEQGLWIENGAVVSTEGALDIDTQQMELAGTLDPGIAVSFSSDRIHVVDGTYSGDRATGLFLEKEMFDHFGELEEIGLAAKSRMQFFGDISLLARNRLLLDAPFIAAGGPSTEAALSAENVFIRNTSEDSARIGSTGGGQFQASAERVILGDAFLEGGQTAGDTGTIHFDGFSAVDLAASIDLFFAGPGELDTGDADLTITAPMVTAIPATDSDFWSAADYRVDAGGGAIRIFPESGNGMMPSGTGGILDMAARTIIHEGRLAIDAGQVRMTATGSGADDGIFLMPGSKISAPGTDLAPGGFIELTAENAPVVISPGATADAAVLDVSAGSQGDAGRIRITSLGRGGRLDGNFQGVASAGKGGSFGLDIHALDIEGGVNRFSELNRRLASGGFSESIHMRVHSGNLTVGFDDVVRAGDVNIGLLHDDATADFQFFNVYGDIDASGEKEGGRVELYSAGTGLFLFSTAEIDASGTGAGSAGGRVVLGTQVTDPTDPAPQGFLNLFGASIDVCPGDDAGVGGSVYFRAPRTAANDEVRLYLEGTVTGASSGVAEAVGIYEDESIATSDFNAWFGDAAAFMQQTTGYKGQTMTLKERIMADLTFTGPGMFTLIPGVEVRSAGAMALGSAPDFTGRRFGSERVPGALTLRAGSDLTVSANLLDHPNPVGVVETSPEVDSWSFRLSAGSNTGSADTLDTAAGSGDLVVKDNVRIYTESGAIELAAGGDGTIGLPPTYAEMPDYMTPTLMMYSVGAFDGGIRGRFGGSLVLNGGIVQTATGDIEFTAGEDLNLNRKTVRSPIFYGGAMDFLGTVRTIGQPPAPDQPFLWADYSLGGDIRLEIEGDVKGGINPLAWDSVFQGQWNPTYFNFPNFPVHPPQGVATLGGGDVHIASSGDVFSAVATFNEGNTSVFAGKNLDGRFLAKSGEMDLVALENFGGMGDPIIEAFDTRLSVSAGNDLVLGTVLNPTVTKVETRDQWNLTYTHETAAQLNAGRDVTITGKVDDSYGMFGEAPLQLLPPTVGISAGRDIRLLTSATLTPSETGNLTLSAGRTIDGTQGGETGLRQAARIGLPDVDPEAVLGTHVVDENGNALRTRDLWGLLRVSFNYADQPLHEGDPEPVSLTAGQDVVNLRFDLPKRFEISAGRDVSDVYILGQNLSADDVSVISAGRNFEYTSTARETFEKGLLLGGPGLVTVQAGNAIDLGTSQGIKLVGNQFNPALPGPAYLDAEGGGESTNDLVLIAGVKEVFTGDEAKEFFEGIRTAGTDYSVALSSGNQSGANAEVAKARNQLIEPILGSGGWGSGDISLINSQIFTSGSNGSISVIATGNIDIGKSSIDPPPIAGASAADADDGNSGIYTTSGGSLNIFTRRDVNVNESRLMTFFGGDITVWTDRGNINAGRGSTVAIQLSDYRVVENEDGTLSLIFEPPAVGSGIRLLTFDLDGVQGPLVPPEPGDAFLFAPEGEIDASEAGIAARNIILGARTVSNVQNIVASGISVGVPKAASGGAAIGALSGAGGLSETSKLAEQSAAALNNSKKRMLGGDDELAESLLPKWLEVRVISFEEE